jgi:BlaI family transcriptional regulator, penicillinase repressor
VTERNITRAPLTDLQQAILDTIWSMGAATSEDLRAALHPRHRLKDSTIRTLLRRLESRGYITHKREGKVFVYRAAIAQRSIAARAVQAIIDRFCAGSAEQFLAGMVDERVLSADEIQKLARRIRSKQSK